MARVLDFLNHQINEASDDKKGTKEHLINLFFEALGEAVEKVNGSSYSINAIHGYDPEKEYTQVLSLLAKEGWKKSALDNLFSKYGDSIMDIYNNGEGGKVPEGIEDNLVPSGSGLADVFFYKMGHSENILSGIDYKTQVQQQGVGEFYIKYGYGYHKTKYGVLVIRSQFGSLEQWFAYAAKHLIDGFLVTGNEDDYILDKSFVDFLKSIKGASPDKFKKIFEKSFTYKDEKGEIDLKAFEVLVTSHHFEALKKKMMQRLGEMGFKNIESSHAANNNFGGRAEIKDDKIILDFEGKGK